MKNKVFASSGIESDGVRSPTVREGRLHKRPSLTVEFLTHLEALLICSCFAKRSDPRNHTKKQSKEEIRRGFFVTLGVCSCDFVDRICSCGRARLNANPSTLAIGRAI